MPQAHPVIPPRPLSRDPEAEQEMESPPYPVGGIVVTLGFDPDELTDKSCADDLRAVFHDRVARNLWLAVKWKHLTSQYFVPDVLRIAASIHQLKPQTIPELATCLH